MRHSVLLVENREIFIPHLYLASPQGVTPRNFVKVFDTCKTRMIGLPCGEEIMTIMLSRSHRIPACDGRTDRPTDGRTIAISISRVSMLMRDKY